MYIPTAILEHQIYDVFQNNKYIIIVGICPDCSIKRQISLFSPNYIIKPIVVWKEFEIIQCLKGFITIYRFLQREYVSNINIKISVETAKNTHCVTYHCISVNHYPSYNNETILSTMVKNEDAYIRQWIHYHRQFGITRFCIYDNAGSPNTRYHSKEKTSNLPELLKDEIRDGIVILIKWPYPKYICTSVSGQVSQQTHAIHAFNKARYIGLFDIDEYLNPQNFLTNVGDMLDNIITLKKTTRDNVGGIALHCRLFFNLYGEDESGYNFLRINHASRLLPHQYRKCFVIPENVLMYTVHVPTISKPLITDIHNISKIIYFNHYFFLNKESRGRDTKEKIHFDDSIMRHSGSLLGTI